MKQGHETNEVKIVDFGIAGLFSGLKSEITNAGSLNYLSPEVLTGKNLSTNPPMDIWAMGCILFALMTGYLPFDDMKEVTFVRLHIILDLSYNHRLIKLKIT